MSNPSMTETIICGGGKPEDTHLASPVHCVDEEIHQWLKRREQRRQLRKRNRRPASKVEHHGSIINARSC